MWINARFSHVCRYIHFWLNLSDPRYRAMFCFLCHPVLCSFIIRFGVIFYHILVEKNSCSITINNSLLSTFSSMHLSQYSEFFFYPHCLRLFSMNGTVRAFPINVYEGSLLHYPHMLTFCCFLIFIVSICHFIQFCISWFIWRYGK